MLASLFLPHKYMATTVTMCVERVAKTWVIWVQIPTEARKK